MREPHDEASYDVVGVGIGPFNLALAALTDPIPGLRTTFFDAKPRFSWHPGMLIDGAELQVPFLADLVTLVDPTSRWSFLNYLREHGRLFPFYFSERFHVPRREYDDYCRWVSASLESCRFGATVTAIRCLDEDFELSYVDGGALRTVTARNVVLGIGTQPVIPTPFDQLLGPRIFHSADYLDRRAGLASACDITVVGSGQSGAEVLLDLLRAQPEHGWRLRWLSRAPAFAPMEYSKLGLEHFTPAYTAYFSSLPQAVRDRLLLSQWQLYKAISAETIAEIYDLLYDRGIGGQWPDVTMMPNVEVVSAYERGACGLELTCRQVEQAQSFRVQTEAVVLATGYANRRPAILDPLANLIAWDSAGRYQIGDDYRVRFVEPGLRAGLYVQNAEAHTHGVGAPDLGLGAHRAAVIINSITSSTAYRLPERTSFTSFGAPSHPPASKELHALAGPR